MVDAVPERRDDPHERDNEPDIDAAVRWAWAHDEQAERIGQQARRFALAHLSPSARQCYWLVLLRELRATLTYTPNLAYYPLAVPLRALLQRRPGCSEWDYTSYPARGLRPNSSYCLEGSEYALNATWKTTERPAERLFRREGGGGGAEDFE